MRFKMSEIGGGRVTRAFRSGGMQVKQGTELSAEFLRSVPQANLNSLLDKNYIHVWPKVAAVSPPVDTNDRAAERHIVSLGFGRFAVIEGRRLNVEALTKEEAVALAGREVAVE